MGRLLAGRARRGIVSACSQSAGSFAEGKRSGEWRVWKEDGTIDPVESGNYENDVKVSDLPPSDAGDFEQD